LSVEATAAAPAKANPGFLKRTFSVFGYRDFRIVWTGAFTSTTGSWMQNVALSWLVYSMTSSTVYLGLIGFLGDLPILLFSLVGGVVADRIDRRKMLLASQYIQMSCAFVLTALVVMHQVQIWHMLALVFIAGVGQSFGGPAYQALIPGLVKREDVSKAIALNSIQFNLARVVGPQLAALAMASVGVALCFFLNGISFIAVIIGLYMIKATFVPTKTGDSVMEGMRGGFRYVKSQGALGQLTVLGFVSTFCGIPLMTLLPVFAKDIFQVGEVGYARMMSTSGVGAILGAIVYAASHHRFRHGLLALRVQLAFAVLLGTFALSRNLWLSYAALFLGGFCLITLFASITSLVQLGTTEEMRGRVMSIFMLAFRGGMPLGNLVTGYLASQLSPSTALLIGSILLASTATAFLASSSGIKKL
jgi:MFS family permease